MRRILMLGIAFIWAIGLNGAIAPTAQANTSPDQLAKAVEAIENLDALRSGLASTLEGKTEPLTAETMKAVCKPVGMEAKRIAQTEGWQLRQVSQKYRNPEHRPQNATELAALEQFSANSELQGLWQRGQVNGQPGTHYFRRINVSPGCLACHGQKSRRPQFVANNYPEDLAYDFKPGDLRGMYATFIPDLTAALNESES